MAVKPVTPRSSPGLLSRLLYPLLIFSVLLIGLVIYTVINGELRLPFGDGAVFAFGKTEAIQETRQRPGQPDGTVAVLACPRMLPAFTKLTREHLLTAEGLHTVPVVEEAIDENGLFRPNATDVRRLLGRVLKRPKGVNYPYSEADLLPAGTRPGPSAGIPPGMRGMWIAADTIPGLADARAGDRLDLVAAEMVDPKTPDLEALGEVSDPRMRMKIQQATMTPTEREVRSWVVARDALVVSPLRRREVMQDARPSSPAKIVEEVMLAMSTEDVARYSQALARDAAIVAAPRSGQPVTEAQEIENSEPADPAADLQRLLFGGDDEDARLGVVEVIRGGKRETVTIPRTDTDKGGR